MEIHEQIQDDEPCEMQDMLPSDILGQFRRKLLEPIREDVLASFRMAEGLRSSDSPCCLAATITVFFV